MTAMRPRKGRRGGSAALLCLIISGVMTGAGSPSTALAQAVVVGPRPADLVALAARARQRFDILPLQDGAGLALIPRVDLGETRLVTVLDGTVSLNAEVVSGNELRRRLPEDSDLLLSLSYLDAASRSTFLSAAAPVETTPAPPATPSAPVPVDRPRGRRSGDIVRVGSNVTVARDQTVTGDVIVIAGSSRILGTVTGDAITVAGRLVLGNDAEVRGDVVAVASQVTRAPGARVDGRFVDALTGVDLDDFTFDFDFDRPFRARSGFPTISRTMRLVGTLMRLALIVLLGWIVVAVAGGPVERIAERASLEPLKAGLVGLLVELLFTPMLILVSVLLALSIVGIPLLALVPVAVLVLIVVFFIGFAAVALRVGRWLGQRLGRADLGEYASVGLGSLLLLSLWVAARFIALPGGLIAGLGAALSLLAFIVEFIAWTIGLGAAVLVRFAPLPPPPDAPAA